MTKQKHVGIALSYANLVLSVCSNVFLTPMLISYLADECYSIYKVMQAFASPLIIFNMGVATIVTREIVCCKDLGREGQKKKQNTLALAMIISLLMAILVFGVGLILRWQIPNLYRNAYSADELELAQKIFILFVCSTAFHILTDTFSGCVVGNEKYIFNSGLVTIKYIFRILLLILFVKFDLGMIAVAAVDLILSVGVFLISAGYALGVLREFPKLSYLNKRELLQIFSFSMAILLQAVVNQVNNNVDTILLGAMVIEKSTVTMYSSALTIYGAYNSIISVVASFYLPDATKLVSRGGTGEEMTDFVIKPGRFQAVVAVGILVGFAILGQNFIGLWIGEQYHQAYWIVLILMIPVTIPLVENTAIAILDATLKRVYRSVVLVVMAVLNVVLSVFLIYLFGFWGAAMGTAVSLVVGHGLLMNLYYAKTFGMNILRMFKGIFKGILPAGVIAGVILAPIAHLLPDGIMFFLLKCLLYVVFYAITLWLVGLALDEKQMVLEIIRKMGKKSNR